MAAEAEADAGFLPTLSHYLGAMADMGASDLFLSAGKPPAYRKDGKVLRTRLPAPSAADMQGFFAEALTPLAAESFRRSPDLDLAHTVPGRGRYRLSLFLHQGLPGLVARRIPPGAVAFEPLGLPASVLRMADAPAGLCLIVGPTGCGKSTTLAALVHHVNRTRAEHIVTIEDPIEFVHEDLRAVVHQRQVGVDTKSFRHALRHVVRQSPDVVMIGELRDRETVETALGAALTGHLVLSTLHAQGAVQTLERLLHLFDASARVQAQADLAHTLVGVVGMRLLPRADGRGRVAAAEVLCATPSVKRMIGEGDLVGLYEAMRSGTHDGMQTLNLSLDRLVRAGAVEASAALRISTNPAELRLLLEGLRTGVQSIDLRLRASPREDAREEDDR